MQRISRKPLELVKSAEDTRDHLTQVEGMDRSWRK